MNELEEKLLRDSLHYITRQVLYRFSRDILEIEIESNIKKDDLIDNIINEVSEYQDQYDELITFINETQEWGRQHIYLFQSSPEERRAFREKSLNDINQSLNEHNIELVANEIVPLFIPETDGYELYKVYHEERRRITIAWAEKRTFHSRKVPSERCE